MLSSREYVTMSIDLNLFFLRIMKEHSLFLKLGFTPKDKCQADEADGFRIVFEKLLIEATDLANGNASRQAIQSQQFVTPYTISAEDLTNFYTCVPTNTGLTRKESMLAASNGAMPAACMREAVNSLNRRAYRATADLARFKDRLLTKVRACKEFTMNYPLLIEHILREARFFMDMLDALADGMNIMGPEDLIDQEVFWNRQMGEHAKFIAGLLDPTEETLIDTARMFGKEFDKLIAESNKANKQALGVNQFTNESIDATKRLRDFKTAGTKGLLDCTIQSIIVPLLADHVLREANHYLCVMGVCNPV